jgi:PAS domain S-box-containing protein
MSQTRILVVEDEGIIALSIQRKLEKMGYDVPVIASSGEEAICEAANIRPDLALMDIMLDGPMDGIEAATQIWQRFKIPVVYLTANSDQQTFQRAKIAEPFGYLLKPFEERELHTAIEIALYKHRMETRLRESEQRLATTLNSIGEAVISTDKEGRITFMNPVAEQLTGWKQAEALGKALPEVLHLIDEESGKRIEAPVSKALQEKRVGSLSDGTLLIARNGSQRAIAGSAAPIKGDGERTSGIVFALRDITERKQAEETIQQAHAELQARSQDLEQANQDLSTILYIVSHDLKEPLRAIENFSNLVNRRYAARLDKKGQDFLRRVVRAAGRMRTLLDDLLKLSRIKRMESSMESIASQMIVEQVLARLQRTIQKTGATVQVVGQLPQLHANRTLLSEAIYNLVSNALKYGIIEDGTGQRVAPEIEITPYSGPEAKAVGIIVKDRGPGVPERHAERIFELFQRAVGREIEGTGAGLAIVRQIAERHGGHAWVEPRKGGGAEFIITFGPAEKQ